MARDTPGPLERIALTGRTGQRSLPGTAKSHLGPRLGSGRIQDPRGCNHWNPLLRDCAAGIRPIVPAVATRSIKAVPHAPQSELRPQERLGAGPPGDAHHSWSRRDKSHTTSPKTTRPDGPASGPPVPAVRQRPRPSLGWRRLAWNRTGLPLHFHRLTFPEKWSRVLSLAFH